MSLLIKGDYLQKMRHILSDSSKFSQICVANKKYLKFLINIEKQTTDLLKQLNDSHVIADTEYKKLKNQDV